MVDLGVRFDSKLTFKDHISEKINKVLVIIKRNFIYMGEHTFVLLYKSMGRPHVKFGNSDWCPFKLGDIEEIEKIQKRATKLIISLKNKLYKERLMQLKFRRMRGDMIEVFKLTHNVYDKSVSPQLSFCTRSNTRENNYKLQNHTFHYDLRKHFLQHVLLIYGTVCQIQLWILTLLMHLDLDQFRLHQEIV